MVVSTISHCVDSLRGRYVAVDVLSELEANIREEEDFCVPFGGQRCEPGRGSETHARTAGCPSPRSLADAP